MGSRERLWEKYGEAWGWPPETMTYEADKRDLLHHEQEIAAHETFNYAILDEPESELLGCVYIDPPGEESGVGRGRIDAVVSWWVVDRMVDSDLDRELREFVPRWLKNAWGFGAVQYAP
jgi:hypothetical protein